MSERRQGHVSDRFGRLLVLYRKSDGSEWGGQDLETATGGVVKRLYITNLKKGRIDSPSLDKLEAIARAMNFSAQPWFSEEAQDQVVDAVLDDEAVRAILEEALRLGPKERQLLLGIARQIASPVKG